MKNERAWCGEVILSLETRELQALSRNLDARNREIGHDYSLDGARLWVGGHEHVGASSSALLEGMRI